MASRELDPEERLDWLRLCRTESVGPISFFAMLRRFGSARAALEALPRLARRSERAKTVTAPPRAATEAELTALHRIGARLVCWGEPAYPSALSAIEDAPPILSVLGRVELLDRPMIAVVGARNASANGRRLARELAAGLGQGGLVVVSGLARGIDAAAHLGGIETGTVGGRRRRRRYRLSRGESRALRRAAPARARSSPSCRSAASRRPAISRAATGSFPGWRSASWSSRPPPALAR